VIAYLLEGLVVPLQRLGLPRMVAVGIVFVLFLVALGLILFGLMPLLSRQVSQLVQQLPSMVAKGQQVLMMLPEKYPGPWAAKWAPSARRCSPGRWPRWWE